MIKLRGGREGGVARQGRVEETEGQTRWMSKGGAGRALHRQGSSPVSEAVSAPAMNPFFIKSY